MVHLERIKELCEKKKVTMKQAAVGIGHDRAELAQNHQGKLY